MPARPTVARLAAAPVALAVVAFTLLCLVSAAASAQGMLLPRDERLQPLELRAQQVEFEVHDRAARTKVTQTFHNHTGSQLEAVYYFALPEGATMTEFAMWMNGERIRGEVLPRGEARQIYESIVRRMRDPGLLEYVNGTLFQASIFPIPPHGDQVVEIEFAHVLAAAGDTVRYHLPIHESTSRYRPAFTVSGTVRSEAGIASVYAPHYEIDVVTEDRTRRRVGAELPRNAASSEDFELFFTLTGGALGATLLTWDGDDQHDGDGYFMLTLSPTEDLRQLAVIPRQVTFVVDTSGSMMGVKMQQARDMLADCISRLEDHDTFNVINFATGVAAAFDGPRPATAANRAAATDFVRALQARGNTNISGALERALQETSGDGRTHAIIFVTDGLPTEGERNVQALVNLVSQATDDRDLRLFTFGVGYDVNTRLLDGMARRGSGRSGYVRPNEDIRQVVGAFFDRVSSPLLTRLELDFGAAVVTELMPGTIPDLYRNEELTILGRYRGSVSTGITVRGQAAASERTSRPGQRGAAPGAPVDVSYTTWQRTFPAQFGAHGHMGDLSFIGNLWASRKVASLMRQIDEEGETPALVESIVALATRWTIVTPWTSFLAVEPSEALAMQDRRDTRGGAPAPGRLAEAEPGRAQRAPAPPRGRSSADGTLAAREEGFMGGSGSGIADRGAPAPAASASMSQRAGATGRAAVEQSIALNDMDRATTVQPVASATSRTVAGRRFELREGVWTQTGVSSRARRTVRYLSDEYFALARSNPQLADILRLGDNIHFEWQGEVIRVTP